MQAEVTAPVTIYGVDREVGEILEVDEATFANLARKGRLAPPTEHIQKEGEKPAKAKRK